MEETLEIAWVGQQVEWNQVNHKGTSNTVYQVDGDSGMAPTCGLFMGDLRKGTMAFFSTFD